MVNKYETLGCYKQLCLILCFSMCFCINRSISSFSGHFQASKSNPWWNTYLLSPNMAKLILFSEIRTKKIDCLNFILKIKWTIYVQFGTQWNLEKHGFARNRLWVIDDNPPPLPVNTAIKTFADLILKPSEEDLKIWPHRFMLDHPALMFMPSFFYVVHLWFCSSSILE